MDIPANAMKNILKKGDVRRVVDEVKTGV